MNEIYQPYIHFLETRRTKNEDRTLPNLQHRAKKVYIDFSQNDYLGFNQSQRLIHDAIQSAKQYGTGATGSPLLSGYNTLQETLAQEIAHGKKKEAVLLFNSGFQANISALSALLSEHIYRLPPLVFFDKSNHASLYQAVFLSKAKIIRYQHSNMMHLAQLLHRYKNSPNRKFIVSETVFGMDGDRVPLQKLCDLAQENGALLYLDEAHATGVWGDKGYGLSTTVSLETLPVIIMGSFSKALGAGGGYIACDQVIKEYLINQSHGFIYSTALSPLLTGAALGAWRSLPYLDQERQELKKQAQSLRESFRERGYNVGLSDTNIIPIILGCTQKTLSVQKELMKRGLLVSAIRPPSVAPQTARLRLSLATYHTQEDVCSLYEALCALL